MAAIAGILSTNGAGEHNGNGFTRDLEKMLESMRHRGPDNAVVRTLPDGTGAMGAVEVNLSRDKTGCTSLGRNPHIVFDGEIYNEQANGRSDVELFQHLYAEHGKDCFSMLDGTFSCAIRDKDELILARDAVGSRPLFYGSENGSIVFGSEMKSLVGHLRFDVKELAPGWMFSTKEGLSPFEPFAPEIPELGSLEEATRTVRDLLIEAVRKRMKGANAVALSGGLDSSIIAAIAREYNPDLLLFTGTIDTAPGPDLENAKLMADFLGLEHHVYRITEQDILDFIPQAVWYLESFDEDCISGIISNYYVARMAKPYTDAILVGEGADELFGGYRMVLKSPKVRDAAHREELAQRLLDIAYNTALRRLDRAWMANAVVYRTPFLDPRVVAFCQKIPMAWKIHGEKQVEKYILREAFRDMLPQKIADREKLRFAMGVGTDDVMDSIVSQFVDPAEIEKRPRAAYGMPFASFKEIYYYDEFLTMFPPAYEQQTVRWDPFK